MRLARELDRKRPLVELLKAAMGHHDNSRALRLFSKRMRIVFILIGVQVSYAIGLIVTIILCRGMI